MCGYVVAFMKDPKRQLSDRVLDSLDRAIRHRGPDEHGQFRLGSVSMGHRRLAVVDIVGGKQPMVSADGRYVLVFNGEIYNYREIRCELASLGHDFKEQSDTEVLLVAWQRWGEGCLKRLNGMFTFAIYDHHAQTLTAARDRFGEKPLYFTETSDAMYLASELKALVAAGVVDKKVDSAALYSYFTLGYVVGEQAIFCGVRRLLPGNILIFSVKDGPQQRPWWQPPVPTEELVNEQAAVTQTLDLLRDSVRMRMVADVPVGFFLSGGVDSSAVVALAAETTSRPLETFSIGFEDSRLDERPYARFVAKRFGTHHHEFMLAPQNLDVLEQMAWHLDEPFADSSALPTWFLSELTRKNVTVALSGDGGDEVFAGYDVYRSYGLSELVRKIPAFLRKLAVGALRSSARFGDSGDRRLRLARNIEDAALPAADRFIAKQQQIFRSEALRSFSPMLAKTEEVERDVFSPLFDSTNSPLGAIALWQQTTSLPNDMLHKVDRMSMAHSLEVRAPLLDHRLVELMNRTSFKIKLPGGRQKYILRKAMSAYFPDDFLWRPKQGFVVPLAKWFKKDLQAFMQDQLLAPRALVHSIIAPDVLGRILNNHALGNQNWDGAIWSLLMFEQWARAYGITPECMPNKSS